MKIKSFLNTNNKEIKSKKFNIFIGISLGNKYFSKGNIKDYILWALEHTKDGVLVVIADKIHAINYQILNKYNPNRALDVAVKKGDETEASIKKIINNLPKEKQGRVRIARWDDVRKSKYYKDKIKIIEKEFHKNKEFHDFILKIVRENLGSRVKDLNLEEVESLAQYVLDEIPIILNKVEFDGKSYDLHPYPGLSLMDDLLMGLQKKEFFPALAEKLDIKNKIAIVEGYAD